MARPRRAKPFNPAEQRRRDFEAVGMQREAADLPKQGDITVTRQAEDRDGKKVDHNVARRVDAFDALKPGMAPGVYDACRRLERDLLLSLTLGDQGRRMERVDCEERETELRFIVAGNIVAQIAKRLSDRDWWLLRELIHPSREYGATWRATVGYITGETHPHAQGARVRAAGVNLLDAYDELDKGETRRAA